LAKSISKTYKVSRRNAGFSEAFRTLFHKQYECIKALDDISFTIGEGEMVGYIGPNGAGKSSTIKMLSGILTPDSGLTTHDMQDIDTLTHRILLIGKGRILLDGNLEEIRKKVDVADHAEDIPSIDEIVAK
jgi:ABC-type uncharacterized transport system ATPase subunit